VSADIAQLQMGGGAVTPERLERILRAAQAETPDHLALFVLVGHFDASGEPRPASLIATANLDAQIFRDLAQRIDEAAV